jgi:hypothetical protein
MLLWRRRQEFARHKSLVDRHLALASSCWPMWKRTAQKDQSFGMLAGATPAKRESHLTPRMEKNDQVAEYGHPLPG